MFIQGIDFVKTRNEKASEKVLHLQFSKNCEAFKSA